MRERWSECGTKQNVSNRFSSTGRRLVVLLVRRTLFLLRELHVDEVAKYGKNKDCICDKFRVDRTMEQRWNFVNPAVSMFNR
jgi:hypothetical protein